MHFLKKKIMLKVNWELAIEWTLSLLLLLYANNCCKHFTYIKAFTPHNNSQSWVFLSSFCKWENWRTERSSKLPKVTQLSNRLAKTWTKAFNSRVPALIYQARLMFFNIQIYLNAGGHRETWRPRTWVESASRFTLNTEQAGLFFTFPLLCIHSEVLIQHLQCTRYQVRG